MIERIIIALSLTIGYAILIIGIWLVIEYIIKGK